MSTTLVRTDPHTLRHLRPDHYRFVAAFDNEPERDCDYYLDDPDRHSLAMDIAAQIGNAPQIAEHWRARLAAEAMPDGHWNRSGGGRCDHCGARPRYVAVLRHLPTGQLLPVGETCLDNRFGDDAVEHLDRLRGQAVARRERVSCRLQRTTWLSADPRHVEAITYLHARVKATDLPVSRFADSVASFWDRPLTTHLTPRQVEALLEMREREAAARRRAEQPDSQAPEGRVSVCGTVVAVRQHDGYKGRRELKLIVRDDRGFAVWMTRTAAIGRTLGWDTGAYRGARVTFTATLARSARDASFAFATRPTQVTATAAA